MTARRHRRRHRAMSLRAVLLLPFFRLPPNNRIERPPASKPLHPSSTPRRSRLPANQRIVVQPIQRGVDALPIADVTARRAISASSCRRLSASSASRRFFSSVLIRCCASPCDLLELRARLVQCARTAANAILKHSATRRIYDLARQIGFCTLRVLAGVVRRRWSFCR